MPDADAPFAELRIARGTVLERRRDGTHRALADPGRTLERWLIEIGASGLEPGIVEALRQDLDQLR
jgi:hypothetical protein